MVVDVRVEDKITCHAWSADRTMLAVCPNSSAVIIFRTPATADGPWERVATLSAHDALVTDIAWAPRTNRILTTSQDRNAYVWNLEPNGEWKERSIETLQLSIMTTLPAARLDRAASWHFWWFAVNF